MKCVVINGTEIKGCTYHLKEILLDELQPEHLQEFYLPKDAPDYCTGCKQCFLECETLCPHNEKVAPIWRAMIDADLIVFAYPVYVLRAPGHVKSLLDHFGVHWFAHRPEPTMFHKTAVILTQSIGAPNRAAQKDVKTSLEWLGVAKIRSIGFGMMEGIRWNEISERRKQKMELKLRTFAGQFKTVEPQRKSIKTRLYFQICKKMQEGVLKKLPEGQSPEADLQYWLDRGWVSQRR